jgi:hypothetical protein
LFAVFSIIYNTTECSFTLFFFVGLVIEPRALQMLDKCSTIELYYLPASHSFCAFISIYWLDGYLELELA